MNIKTPKLAVTASVVAALSLNGCATSLTLQNAKGSTCINKKGETVIVEKPRPALYGMLPFAAVADIASIPFWVGVTVAVNLGLMKPPI